MNSTPFSLLDRLRQPDAQAAWDRFVQLYTPLLLHWARRLGQNEVDAADLVQEVFVILVRELPRFRYRPDARFRGWLWTVLRNKARERRRQALSRPVEVGANHLDGHEGNGEDVPLEEHEYRQYLVSRALQVMQSDFQAATWRACWEHVVAGRPAAEVAAELGLSVNAVHLAKARVLRRLREELNGLFD
jgi:RNA polymerase sigma-70 factor (ECF subfamily)